MIRSAWSVGLCLACWALCCGHSWAEDASPITMHYYERKPFHYSTGPGQVAGLVVTPTVQAFEKIGVPINWELTPANRILATLKANIGSDCSPGWYKTPERENYARYTLPIYRDKPLVAIVRADFPVPDVITAKELYLRPHIRLITKLGFVHGAYLEQIIARIPPKNIVKVSDEMPSIIRMVQSGIADLLTATQEEAEFYASQAGAGMKEFRVIRLPDVPVEEKRYILCSKRVPEDVVEKLDVVIKAMQIESAHTP